MSEQSTNISAGKLTQAVHMSLLAPALAYLPLIVMVWIGNSPGNGQLAVNAWLMTVVAPFAGVIGLLQLKAWNRLLYTAIFAIPASFVMWFLSAGLVAIFKNFWLGLFPSMSVAVLVYLMTDVYVSRIRRRQA